MKPGLIGADIGGSTTKVGVFDDVHATEPLVSDAIPTAKDFDEAMANAADLIKTLADKAGVTVHKVGLTVAARLNLQCDTIEMAGSVSGWVGRNFVKAMGRYFPGILIIGHNDAAGQGLIDALRNQALYGQPFLMWLPGTGIGTAQVAWEPQPNGQMKPRAYASEAQHAQIEPQGGLYNPKICGCGQIGCTEALGSGRAAQEIFGQLASELSDDDLKLLLRNQARGLANTLAVLPYVNKVVLGGGLPAREPRMLGWLQEELNAMAIGGMTAQIVPSKFGESAGFLGALALLEVAAAA